MKKNIYLILLISSLLYQTLNSSMDHKQIKKISSPQSFALIDNNIIAIANANGCYLLDLRNDNQPTTLHTGRSTIKCVFNNNQNILLSISCPTTNNRQLIMYDLTKNNEILPRLSKKCLFSFVLVNDLVFTADTNNQQQCTIIDTNNREYVLPINCDVRPAASNPAARELLFVPNTPSPSQKLILANLDSPIKPTIKEFSPTFFKDNPKKISDVIYSCDGQWIAFELSSSFYATDDHYQWYVYNKKTDKSNNPIKCKRLAFSPNNSTVACLSRNNAIVYIDIKVDQTVYTSSFEWKHDTSTYTKLSFSPNGKQLTILANNNISLLDVPTEALNPPSLWAVICPQLLLLKSYQYDHIKLLPNELVSLIIKKLASLFGYSVKA